MLRIVLPGADSDIDPDIFLWEGYSLEDLLINKDTQVTGTPGLALWFTPGGGGAKLLTKFIQFFSKGKKAAQAAKTGYEGVKAASEYLIKSGVPRATRVQILQSFEVGTVSLRTAGQTTYGMRFFGGNSKALGRYLFPTFTNGTGRAGLALPEIWNSMTGIAQYQIRPGAAYIYGRAAAQGGRFTGGQNQIYVRLLEDLIKLK